MSFHHRVLEIDFLLCAPMRAVFQCIYNDNMHLDDIYIERFVSH